MPKKRPFKLLPRDEEVFAVLEHTPLTIKQIMKISQTFSERFKDKDNLGRRMRQLRSNGYVKSWSYGFPTNGRSANYFKLTPKSFRYVGDVDDMPSPTYFSEVQNHKHTVKLADFIVHLMVLAHRAGFEIRNLTRENSVSLSLEGINDSEGTMNDDAKILVRPDLGFELIVNGRPFRFFVEIDNGTERGIVSSRIDAKIRGYLAYARSLPSDQQFSVLWVATKSEIRAANLVMRSAQYVQSQKQTLFYGATLDAFCQSMDLENDRIWLDVQSRRRSMIRNVSRPEKKTGKKTVSQNFEISYD